jgi:hypothetical protein
MITVASGLLAALGRAWRWKPTSHLQVWLIAAVEGLVCFIIFSALGGALAVRVVVILGVVIGFGAGQSYRLGRRE